jgi:hypothetical protein
MKPQGTGNMNALIEHRGQHGGAIATAILLTGLAGTIGCTGEIGGSTDPTTTGATSGTTSRLVQASEAAKSNFGVLVWEVGPGKGKTPVLTLKGLDAKGERVAEFRLKSLSDNQGVELTPQGEQVKQAFEPRSAQMLKQAMLDLGSQSVPYDVSCDWMPIEVVVACAEGGRAGCVVSFIEYVLQCWETNSQCPSPGAEGTCGNPEEGGSSGGGGGTTGSES